MENNKIVLTGAEIKEIRQRYGLSQQQFGARLGVTHAHISKIENGKEVPSETLLRLIKYEFGLSHLVGTPPAEATKEQIKKYISIIEEFVLNGNMSDGSLFSTEFILAAYINVLNETKGSDMFQELITVSLGMIVDQVAQFLEESNNLNKKANRTTHLATRFQRVKLEISDNCNEIYSLLQERI